MSTNGKGSVSADLFWIVAIIVIFMAVAAMMAQIVRDRDMARQQRQPEQEISAPGSVRLLNAAGPYYGKVKAICDPVTGNLLYVVTRGITVIPAGSPGNNCPASQK